jgi:hypothetical protein
MFYPLPDIAALIGKGFLEERELENRSAGLFVDARLSLDS